MNLLMFAVIAFVVALLAGAFGFTGVAGAAASVGRVLFGLFLLLAALFLVLAVFGGKLLF